MNGDETSELDKKIQEAKARKAKRAGTNADGETGTTETSTANAKRPRLSDEEKAARNAAREAEKANRKAEREANRAAKKAEKDATRTPAHMAKVMKAASRLPALNEAAQVAYNDITANFTRDQVNAIAQHLTHFNRVKATEMALGQKVGAGDTVRILDGDSRYVGMTGTVVKAQRIRCYVEVEGAKKPVYLFTSQVELIKAAAKTGTNG